jgi:hypothetical protein
MDGEPTQIDWSQLPTLSAHWQASGDDGALQQQFGIDMSQEGGGSGQAPSIDWSQLPTLSAHWQAEGDDAALQQHLGIDMSAEQN